MYTRVQVPTNKLKNIPALERELGAKVIDAVINGESATVSVLPVADLSWCVDVWNCRADLALVGKDGAHTYIDEQFEVDADQLEALIDRVVYDDNGGALNISGKYWPRSKASLRAFARLMANARPKKSA